MHSRTDPPSCGDAIHAAILLLIGMVLLMLVAHGLGTSYSAAHMPLISRIAYALLGCAAAVGLYAGVGYVITDGFRK